MSCVKGSFACLIQLSKATLISIQYASLLYNDDSNQINSGGFYW